MMQPMSPRKLRSSRKRAQRVPMIMGRLSRLWMMVVWASPSWRDDMPLDLVRGPHRLLGARGVGILRWPLTPAVTSGPAAAIAQGKARFRASRQRPNCVDPRCSDRSRRIPAASRFDPFATPSGNDRYLRNPASAAASSNGIRPDRGQSRPDGTDLKSGPPRGLRLGSGAHDPLVHLSQYAPSRSLAARTAGVDV